MLTRIAGVLTAASLLAACGGQSGSVPASSTTASTHNAGSTPISVPFTRTTNFGTVIHYMPTRDMFLRSGLSLRPSNSNNMTYHGGPIQSTPKMYVIFWGGVWNSGGDPDGVKPYLMSFARGLKGSQWTKVMNQYYGPVGTYIHNSTTVMGRWTDTVDPLPASPTDSQLAAEAAAGAAHFGDYSVSASYVVALPSGHDPNGFGTSYCAYHSSQAVGSNTIAWTNLPYMPDAGASCGEGFVNNPGTLDGVSIVEGHEQAETETDPQPFSGWWGPLSEIGDACAWQNLQNTTFKTGVFPTQPLWSNSAGGCVQ